MPYVPFTSLAPGRAAWIYVHRCVFTYPHVSNAVCRELPIGEPPAIYVFINAGRRLLSRGRRPPTPAPKLQPGDSRPPQPAPLLGAVSCVSGVLRKSYFISIQARSSVSPPAPEISRPECALPK